MVGEQPNIVLIVSDQHRADWLGAAEHPFVQTPNLDSLAAQGVQFAQTYCSAPLCVPSRMSMMAGKYPSTIDVWNNLDTLSSEEPTIAHALALVEYETVLCGRMHFVGPDQRHGYAQRLVGDITPSLPGGQGVDYGTLRGTTGAGRKSLELSGPGASKVQEYDEAVTQGCETFLQAWAADHTSQPLFLTVGYYAPHHPYVAPEELYNQYLDKVDVPPVTMGQHPWLADWHEQYKIHNLGGDVIRRVRAAYAGMCTFMDQQVGRVLQAVKSLGENTIIVYVSDHGEMAGEHGMFWKRTYYEGALRVPCIFSGPGIKAGAVSNSLASLVDLAPTLCELAGAPPIPHTDGCSLVPLLNDPLADLWPDRAIFSELCWQQTKPSRMVRQGPWKLVYYHGYDTVQLFNLADDPQELHDLGADPRWTTVRDTLQALLLHGWDPNEIHQSVLEKSVNQRYLSAWAGKTEQRGDLWPYIQPTHGDK